MLSKRAVNCVLCSALHRAGRFLACLSKKQVPAAHGAHSTQGTQDGANGRISGSLWPRNQFSTSVTRAGVGSPYRRSA